MITSYHVTTSENKLIYYLFLLLIIVLYAFSTYKLLSVTMQALFVAVIFLEILRVHKFRLTIHFLWMSLFIVWGLFISFFSYDISTSLSDVVNISFKLALLTSIIVFIDTEGKFNFALKSILLSGIVLAIVILLTVPLSDLGTDRLGKIVDVNSNRLGIVLSYAFISAIYLSITLRKYKYLFPLPLFITLILLTGSRKSLFAVGIAIILIMLLYSKDIKKLFSRLIIASGILYGMYFLIMTIPTLYKIIGRRVESIGIFNGTLDASMVTRTTMLQEGFDLFLEKPIVGYGLENYRLLSIYETYSHSNYIELLTSVGIIGTLIYYSLLIYLLTSSLIGRLKGDLRFNIIIIFLITILLMDATLVSYKHLITQVIIAISTSYFIYLKKTKVNNDQVKNQRGHVHVPENY